MIIQLDLNKNDIKIYVWPEILQEEVWWTFTVTFEVQFLFKSLNLRLLHKYFSLN